MQLYLIVRIVLYVHIIVKQHKTKNDECTNTNKHIHAYTHTGRQRITQKLMLIKNVCGGTGTTTTTTSALTNSNSCCHCCFSWSSCCCCYLFCCCCILINSCCCQNRTSAHTHTANKQTKHMYIHMFMYTRGHAHTHLHNFLYYILLLPFNAHYELSPFSFSQHLPQPVARTGT